MDTDGGTDENLKLKSCLVQEEYDIVFWEIELVKLMYKLCLL